MITTTNELKVNQNIYLVNDMGKVYTTKIYSISQTTFTVTPIYLNQSQAEHFTINEQNNGNIYVPYNKTEKVRYFINQEDAAVYKKNAVKQKVLELRVLAEKAIQNLIDFRKANFDILNSTEVDLWIKEFKQNNNW